MKSSQNGRAAASCSNSGSRPVESPVPQKEHRTAVNNFHDRPKEHHPVDKNQVHTNSKGLARVRSAHLTPLAPKAATPHAVNSAPRTFASGVIRHPKLRFLVQALVTGEHPSALISRGGTVKAIAVGDSVDGMLVSAIHENQIEFSDGTTLHLRGEKK